MERPGTPTLSVMTARTGFLVATALLASITLTGIWLPGWTYLPVNLAAILALLLIARRAGATDTSLGLRRDRLRRGLIVGALSALAIGTVLAAAATIPSTRGLFEDSRAAGIGVAGLLYQVVLRIPIGTALFEEVAFRGVLLGLGRKAWAPAIGTGLSALLFGLWHVAPALDLAGANATATGISTPGVVVLAVTSTAIAGLGFTWLRDRSDSLAAPVLVHTAANAFAFTFAWALF